MRHFNGDGFGSRFDNPDFENPGGDNSRLPGGYFRDGFGNPSFQPGYGEGFGVGNSGATNPNFSTGAGFASAGFAPGFGGAFDQGFGGQGSGFGGPSFGPGFGGSAYGPGFGTPGFRPGFAGSGSGQDFAGTDFGPGPSGPANPGYGGPGFAGPLTPFLTGFAGPNAYPGFGAGTFPPGYGPFNPPFSGPAFGPMTAEEDLVEESALPYYRENGLPTDDEIVEMIYDAFDEDPLIPWDADIDVTSDAGMVTLTGSVPNKRVKHAAGDDSWWIPGVDDVRNEIRVVAAASPSSTLTHRTGHPLAAGATSGNPTSAGQHEASPSNLTVTPSTGESATHPLFATGSPTPFSGTGPASTSATGSATSAEDSQTPESGSSTSGPESEISAARRRSRKSAE